MGAEVSPLSATGAETQSPVLWNYRKAQRSFSLPRWLSGKNPPADDADSPPGSERCPEEEMASHPSILAWEIPGPEEHGGLRSMGSQESHTT